LSKSQPTPFSISGARRVSGCAIPIRAVPLAMEVILLKAEADRRFGF